jgi:hypothetical protein
MADIPTPRPHDSATGAGRANRHGPLGAEAERWYAKVWTLLAGLEGELAPDQYQRVTAAVDAMEGGAGASMLAEMEYYEGAIVAHLANVPALWRLLDAHVRDGGYPPAICPVCQREEAHS